MEVIRERERTDGKTNISKSGWKEKQGTRGLRLLSTITLAMLENI